MPTSGSDAAHHPHQLGKHDFLSWCGSNMMCVHLYVMHMCDTHESCYLNINIIFIFFSFLTLNKVFFFQLN